MLVSKHFCRPCLVDARKAFHGLVILFICSCSPDSQAPISSLDESRAVNSSTGDTDVQIDCGNLVTMTELGAYVELIHSLEKTARLSNTRDERLFAANVTLIENGAASRFTREKLGVYSGSLPSLHDWQVIASGIAAGGLKSGGWRGCFLSSGKAFFEADGNGDIGLTAFDFDRQWELK